MKLTIIPSDGAVYKDGYCYSRLDLSFVFTNIHALQWENTAGWIEFVQNNDGTKLQNEIITALPDWAYTCLTKWDEAKISEEIAIAEAIANQPTKEQQIAKLQEQIDALKA